MKEKTILLAIYILVLLGIILLAVSCSVEKKNAKAVNRVKADVNPLNEVGKDWAKLNPCSNDTTTVTDTVTNEVQVPGETTYDTTRINDTVYLTKTVKTETVKTKTVYRDRYIKDNRELDIIRKELASAIKAKDLAQQGEIKAKDKYEEERKLKNLFKWILYGLGALLIGFGVYKIWPKVPGR